ncbi:MAG: SRPBCC family protein [Actinobacteria bacterium]|nr:SRPBCC family protein [Actinomycetota bacterium]
MGVDVLTQIEIERPRGDVASFAADPSNATRWYRNIHAVTWETSPPLAVGSRVRFRARFLGRTLEYTYEVREFEPLERLVQGTTDGPLSMETTYAWSDTERGTQMTLRNRGEPEGFMGMIGGVLEAAMRRANRADLARLKALLEAEDPGTG